MESALNVNDPSIIVTYAESIEHIARLLDEEARFLSFKIIGSRKVDENN
jgi:hypothetical protein